MKCQVRGIGSVAYQLVGVLAREWPAAGRVRRTGRHWRRGRPRPLTVPSLGWNQWHSACTCRYNKCNRSISYHTIGGLPQKRRQSSTTTSVLRDAAELSIILRSDRSQEYRLFERYLSIQERNDAALELSEALHKLDARAKLLSLEELSVAAEIAATSGIWRSGSQTSAAGILGTIVSETRLRWECDSPVATEPSQPGVGEHDGGAPVDVASASARDPESMSRWPTAAAHTDSIVRFSRAAGAAMLHAALQSRLGRSASSDPDSSAFDAAPPPEEAEWLAAFASSGIAAAARNIPEARPAKESGEMDRSEEATAANAGTADLRAVSAALQALSPQRILEGAFDGSTSLADDDVGSVVEILRRDRYELLGTLNCWIGPFYVGAARAVASGLGRLRSKATVYAYMNDIGRGKSRDANDLKGGLGGAASQHMHLLVGRDSESYKVGTVEGVQLAADLGKCMLEARELVSELALPRPSPRLVTRTGPFSPWAGLSRIVRWSVRQGASSEMAQRGGHVLALPLAEVILTLRAAVAATAYIDLASSGPESDAIRWPADPELQLLALPAIIGSNAAPDDDVAHPPGVLTRAIGAVTSWIGSQLGVRASSISPRAVTAPRLYPAIDVWPSSERDRIGTEPTSELGDHASGKSGVRAPPLRHRQDAMQLVLDLAEESASKLVQEWAASADSLNTSRDGSTLCMLRPPEHRTVTEYPFDSSGEGNGAHDSTSTPIPFWDLGLLDKGGDSAAPLVEATGATKPEPTDAEHAHTEEHGEDIAMPKWLEYIGPLEGASAGEKGLPSQGTGDGTWEEADPREEITAPVLSAASDIIPSDLAAALLGYRRDDESLVGVSPVYSAADIKAAIDALSQEEDKALFEDAVYEPVTRVKVRIGATGDDSNSDSSSQQDQGHITQPDARVQDVKIRGPFAILRRFRSGLGAGVDSYEGERWVLQWSTPSSGSEGALACQREGRMPWEAEFDFEWSAPEDSNRAEPKHPVHVRSGATATGILPDPAGTSSQADPLFVPPSVLAGVYEEDFTRESDARAGSKFGPGRRHGHSLRYRTRSAILDLARHHTKDSVDAATLARHMEAVVGMGGDELERWMLDDDSEAVGMARARHVLECLEADDLTASDSTRGNRASAWPVSTAASALAAAENDHSRTGEGNGLDVRNGGIALGPGSYKIALAWRDITLDAVAQQGERFPELAELPDDSRGDGRLGAVKHKDSKSKSSWSRSRSWVAAEGMLRQHLGLPKETAPRVRLYPAESSGQGSSDEPLTADCHAPDAGLSLPSGPTPYALDDRNDGHAVPGDSPDTISLASGQSTRSQGPSAHLATMVLQLAAGQLQTNGRAAAEHSLSMACSVPDAALEATGRASIGGGTGANAGLPAGAGHELLRHADDETLVAAGCDIAAWYGADATPTLRHVVHCIADELLAVRGPRLAKENRGLLAEALRGLRPVSAGSWSPHGVDIVAERQELGRLQRGTGGKRGETDVGNDATSSGSLSYLLRPVGSGPPGYEPDGSSTGEIPGRTNANGEWVPLSPAATGPQRQMSVIAASGARRCLQAICSAVASSERSSSNSTNEALAGELLAWGAANGGKLARCVHPNESGHTRAAAQLRALLDSLDQRQHQDLLEHSLGCFATRLAKRRGPFAGQLRGYDRVPIDVAEVIVSYMRDCARYGKQKYESEQDEIPMSRIKISFGGADYGQYRLAAQHATTASQCDLALDAIRSARQRSLEANLESYPDVNLPCELVYGWRRHVKYLSGSGTLDLQDVSSALGPMGSVGAAISRI